MTPLETNDSIKYVPCSEYVFIQPSVDDVVTDGTYKQITDSQAVYKSICL